MRLIKDFLTALTFDTTVVAGEIQVAVVNETAWNDTQGGLAGGGVVAGTVTLAVDTSDDGVALELGDLDAIVFTTALQNIATLRAQNGGSVKRLQYAQADVDSKIANMTAAHGRIMDVDSCCGVFQLSQATNLGTGIRRDDGTGQHR